MKAVVYDRYGSPELLRVEEVPVPSPRRGPGAVTSWTVCARRMVVAAASEMLKCLILPDPMVPEGPDRISRQCRTAEVI